uniref:Annexin B11 (Trinotate prediction) n=1 Tax=Henneguya salminicola TaxID=69463 RepID=A0A6G3MHS2_HENSL
MGSLGKMASFLLHTPRDGCQYTDLNEAVKIAKDLHRQSSVQIKAPDSLTPLFCKTNYVQLSLIMQEYTKLSGKSLYHHIKGYSEGSYEKALMAICNYTANPLHYFSKHLSEGIKKKNINQVCRVVCTRFEIDLVSIQQDYMATYNREAAEDIRQAFGSSMKSTIEALESLMGR